MASIYSLRRMGQQCAWSIVVASSIAAFTGAAQSTPYKLVDLASSYASFWDESQDMPAAERVAAFKARFETLLPRFFSAERVGWMTNEQYDAAIVQSFDRFPAIRDHVATITADFAKLLAPAHESFARAFPDLRPIGPVYIVHSLGEFDGGTRTVSGESRLVFGADVMAQVHGFSDERPFFHHELFHVYHAQFFTDCEEMWCAVWSEGLAVLAAQRLNPRATDAELLLSSPRPIRPEVERNQNAAVCAVASRLTSTDGADYAGLFSNGPPIAKLPPRVGYYVGYLVATEAARNRSITQLAHLDNEAARDLLTVTFARLADC
jgi:hypothetical protein